MISFIFQDDDNNVGRKIIYYKRSEGVLGVFLIHRMCEIIENCIKIMLKVYWVIVVNSHMALVSRYWSPYCQKSFNYVIVTSNEQYVYLYACVYF